jgi:hypothetical protein
MQLPCQELRPSAGCADLRPVARQGLAVLGFGYRHGKPGRGTLGGGAQCRKNKAN